MNTTALYNLFVSHPESQWIMRPVSAQQLHAYLSRKQPKRILDLGTGIGCTAAFMALACPKAEVHTVEQSKKCVDIAKSLIPEELQKNIKFHRTDPEVWEHEDIPYQYFSKFKKLPEGDFDFILVDGPGPWTDVKGTYIDLPNADVLNLMLEKKLKKGTLVAWDGRIPALRLLERFVGDNFYLVEQGDGSDFNVIEFKGTHKFSDGRLEIMKESGYVNQLSNRKRGSRKSDSTSS